MPTRRRVILAICLIVAVAAALRIPGYFTDFWLDEIWSYDIARGASDWHIDNNHLLNTWLIKAIGQHADWHLYRIPPLLFGIGSVILAALVMRRRGNAQMLIATILLAFSFPFVFYSSEARGYAPVVFFALLAMEAMLAFVEKRTEKRRWTSAVVFSFSCVLGFCSHLTFVHFYFAACMWTFLLTMRRQPRDWLKLNAIPMLFFIALYATFIRDITIGGAAPRDWKWVMIETLSAPSGGPPVGMLGIVAAVIAAIVFIGAMIVLARRNDPLVIFFVLSVAIAPTLFVVYHLFFSVKPQPLMLRYFLVALAMLLLATAEFGAWLWKSGPPGRVIVGALVLVFVGANLTKTMNFYRYGRGGYTRAIARIYALSPDAVVTVDADNEYASGRAVDFYAPRLAPPGRSIDFYHDREKAARAAHPPEWVIVSRSADVAQKRSVRVTPANEVYRLDSEYPSESLSGIPWLLYRIDIPATIRMQATSQPSR